MVSMEELRILIDKARDKGAAVIVSFDKKAQESEGREIVNTVQVLGLEGCGSYPMTAIAAAERLRELTA